MSGRRLGRKGLETLREDLSGRDITIVRQVADLKLMSARQIEAVHFTLADHASGATAARSARRVLERLVRDRLLIRLARRVGGIRAGSAAFVYALGPVGQRLLGDDQPRLRFREPSATFAVHTLAISQLVVDVIAESRSSGRLDLLGLQAEPVCWRSSVGPIGGVTVLRPDLFAVVGVGDYEYRWFVEVDLGSEHLPTLIRKCAAYEAYYQTGQEQSKHGVFPRVLWIMDEHDRAERLRQAIVTNAQLTIALFTVTTAPTALDALCGGQA